MTEGDTKLRIPSKEKKELTTNNYTIKLLINKLHELYIYG